VSGITPGALRLPDDHALLRMRRAALAVGVVGLVALLIGWFVDPDQCLRSYLVGYVFWIGVPLGGLAVLLIHGVTGGAWGVAIRRPLESAALTLPLMALLFLPLALGASRLYLWAQPEVVAHDPLLQHKALYLNWPFFCARAVLYFVSWILVARVIGVGVFHDLGNLLLAFTMLWGYFQLSQFLITWSANIPEEITWYLARVRGGWWLVTVLLVFIHLFLPFAVLLSRNVKRWPVALAAVAVWMLAGRLLAVFWLVRPPFTPPDAAFHVLDVAALAGVGGLFLALFVDRLAARPVLPLHDPSLPVAEVEA